MFGGAGGRGGKGAGAGGAAGSGGSRASGGPTPPVASGEAAPRDKHVVVPVEVVLRGAGTDNPR